MKRILVTGASGFLGYPLVNSLARAGYETRAAVRRPPERPFPTGVEVVQHPDLADPIDWPPLLAGIDAVIHLAGIAHAEKSTPDFRYDCVNRSATAELASAAKRSGIRRFVYISSVRAQSGPTAAHVLKETDDPTPTDAYGRSKLAAEDAVRATGLPFVILRPTLVFGPGVKGNMRALLRLANLPLPLPFGALANRRSLLSIDNFIGAVSFVLTSPAVTDEIFVLADPRPSSIAEIVSALRRGLGRDADLVSMSPALLRALLVFARLSSVWDRIGGTLVVDPSKLMDAGWVPKTDTAAALSLTAASFIFSSGDPAR
jgi:nucleoside-diphosphate-sugar epimerase